MWIDGKRYEVGEKPKVDPRGTWQLSLALPDSALEVELKLEGEVGKLSGSIDRGSISTKLGKVALEHRRLTLSFAGDSLGYAGILRLSGRAAEEYLGGRGQLPDGRRFAWRATEAWLAPDSTAAEGWESAPDSTVAEPALESLLPPVYPPGAYGYAERPEQPRHLLVKNATIWTSGAQGVLENADLLVEEGEIVAVGTSLKAPTAALVVDAVGKHVTPGLVDAHTHIASTGGLNEAGQAVSAEVRVGDVLDSYDMLIYRLMAGGATTLHVMHGSANPIGGQNATIKLRWSAPPEELKFKGAAPTIKFALGENVKQSNWGDGHTTRYPQTRMGVEQIIRDRLQAARDYERSWKDYRAAGAKKGRTPPRRDLELEALVEVLAGERLVHCHSYRQDEILMMMRVAEDFGFRIGTFQHILEGYKVAEIMAAHGAHASTFSDWWAYKFEVYDAIPHNAALMHRVGVGVSINSDLWNWGWRLNTEAAKVVRYGGVSEEEALRFVTINPAVQLGVDHRVGSLEKGKDADFVVWSGHPLSTYSRCEQTWIDGRRYFDIERDAELRREVDHERARLVQDKRRSG